MNETNHTYLGETVMLAATEPVEGEFVDLQGETYYRIGHVDQLPTFFITLVSSADHWLFICSNGGLTAGRINADSALFPYETEDKLAAAAETTGGKTLVRIRRDGKTYLWEPFSERLAGIYRRERHLYKNVIGNKLVFEERNLDLKLVLRISWRVGDRFGFVRSGELTNEGDACHVELLDGLQGLLPYGATAAVQTSFSNLLHAYKRNELDRATGLGIFALSATLTDRAEPSESLQATVAWQTGLEAPRHLLSAVQLDAFRDGRAIVQEEDQRGVPGAYFAQAAFDLEGNGAKRWHIVADVNQDAAAIVRLRDLLCDDQAALRRELEADIDRTTDALVGRVAAADGIQQSADRATSAHHFANVLFNIMRGGIFATGYRIDKADVVDFFRVRNRSVLEAQAEWFATLPDVLDIQTLYARATDSGSADLVRLCYEYLPLTFSRRHGDPSRPWNRFSINIKKEDGSPNLDYQGNWRDIFQNWEALALSFPAYIPGIISKFLNATTADGYNPYRVTRAGIEWEIPEPDSPWANIGYWNDHQIIYLLKLLEIAEQVDPDFLSRHWNQPIFAYANVPYRLRPYPDMLADWTNTIDFEWRVEETVQAAISSIGTDGRLLMDATGRVIHVTMIEKLLVLLLTKLTNFVPDGGIWMNTQRPEWNDANNALVGKGLSVVTVAYLRRFIAFWRAALVGRDEELFEINAAVVTLLVDVRRAMILHRQYLEAGFDEGARRAFMDEMGAASTSYRSAVYRNKAMETWTEVGGWELRDFLIQAQTFLETTLEANRRDDGLFHSYNTLRLGEGTSSVDHLQLMLEGQVAILSSGTLEPDKSLRLLHALRRSELYRADQHSYMLYPNRRLPAFLEKNRIEPDQVAGLALVSALMAAGDSRVLVRDVAGHFHFNGRFRNARDLARTLDELAADPAYAALVDTDRLTLLDLFEATFDHRAFTGRSGTFFAYEGLGSIYWHMVAKLLLAAQECHQQAVHLNAGLEVIAGLADAYRDIRAGLGFNKSPAEFGAFPTDPYSHTPAGAGARQPGMTGQVKEEILTRLGELGISVRAGVLYFEPTLLDDDEFLTDGARFVLRNVDGQQVSLDLPPNSMAFSVCATPVIYLRSGSPRIEVICVDGRSETIHGRRLGPELSRHVLDRDGFVQEIWVYGVGSTRASDLAE